MPKVKIKIAFWGYLPDSLNEKRITKWKSELFEIIGPINEISIICESNGGPDWEYNDTAIEQALPNPGNNADILLAVTNASLQNNYFTRPFSGNRLCMTYREMSAFLHSENIPLENLLLRVLYSVSLVYKSHGNRLPLMNEIGNILHDDSRCCIFDKDGHKVDVIYSATKPIICPACFHRLSTNTNPNFIIPINLLEKIGKELRKIKKAKFHRITDFVKKYPVFSFFISSLIAIFLGIVGSLVASFIFEKIK